MKLTKAQARAALWLHENGPIGAIPAEIGLRTVKKLVIAGLAEEAGREPGVFGCVKFQLTPAGRSALESQQ